MKIILFDIIGMKSGCKYYDIAFYKQLLSHGFDAEIHSNFSIDDTTNPSIENIYIGNKISKLLKLIKLLPNFAKDVIKNKNNKFVYMTYGEIIDCLMIAIFVIFHPKPMLDVHEFISLDKQNNKLYNWLFKMLYRRIYAVIYHSERSKQYLNKIHYCGNKLFVPHFKYEFSKEYAPQSIDTEIIKSCKTSKIKILFFGHMRKSKGIDMVLNSISITPKNVLDNLHFIFAGSDPHGIVKNKLMDLNEKASLSTILRYIQDEELNYLFDNADLILLPYEEVSQSGILETAVYFRKPMILSDIAYFKSFATAFPSFVYMIRKDDVTMLSKTYSKISSNGLKKYNQAEINSFYETDKFDTFFNKLSRCS